MYAYDSTTKPNEANNVELSAKSKQVIYNFRQLIKENAELGGWKDPFVDGYTTESLVECLIEYGYTEYLRGVEYDRKNKEAQ